MCRWVAYTGQPAFLEELIARPDHSLISQSLGATECKMRTNGDGFGLAWYAHRPEPGLYRDVMPAWSDPNLRAIAAQVRSGLFMAHVRASTGAATSRNNCHPFAHGRWSFMHNGQIGGFDAVRKRADMAIPDALYGHRKGATDSEALFLVALGEGIDGDPVAAMARAVSKLSALSEEVPLIRFTAALSDGHRIYAFRYASDDHAPSLYHRWNARLGGREIASEPLEEPNGWASVEPGACMIFEGEAVRLQSFDPLGRARAA